MAKAILGDDENTQKKTINNAFKKCKSIEVK